MKVNRLVGLGLAAVLAFGIAACGDDDGGTVEDDFLVSLHATGQGKITFYAAENGGFEQYTSVPYNDLACKSCHQPLCENCHEVEGDVPATEKCMACHGRQGAEATHYSDVHRTAGMECMDCHSSHEMHGDGTQYTSLLDAGAMDTECEDCHTTLASNTYHNQHSANIDCSACHMQGVVTCNNCHFESQIVDDVKKAYGQFKDWMFLINFEGKVHAANYQSVMYEDASFLAFAPFYAHSVSKNAVTCSSCHNSQAVQAYDADGEIQVVEWNAGTSALEYMTGIIPIPPDYETSMLFDFVDLNGAGDWIFMEAGPDDWQMPFGTPLTTAQMNDLINITP